MFQIYLKVAWRNLIKNKGYTLLNIFGLATGMAVALLIGLWVFYQFSYDRFLPGYDGAYQVKYNSRGSAETYTQDQVPIPLAEVMKRDVPGVEYVALAFSTATFGPLSQTLSVGDKTLGPTGFATEPDFLKIFRFPLLKGTADDVLSDPRSIVISESTAKALFGNEDPMGKTVHYNNDVALKVTGVLKDVPANSTFKFDFLTPFATLESGGWVHDAVTEWNQDGFRVYVSLRPHVTYAQVEPQISMLVKKYAPSLYQTLHQEVIMQPLKDWHLFSEYKNGVEAGGLIEYVRIFIIIGILVLVIACINFMNLSTAYSEKRAMEVGIRKVMGSTRSWLVIQFLMESILLAFAAFILALILVQLALPEFNAMARTDIHIPYANPIFWLLMISYILFTGCLAGSRPAFYLSSFQPVKVLKGKLSAGKLAALPRKILVVLQFSSSIAFIIGTVIIYQQIEYAKNRPRGYDPEQLVVTEGVNGDYAALKQAALQSRLITSMTASLSPPTEVYWYGDVEHWTGGVENNRPVKVALNAVGDADYFKTLGITFKEGRNFVGDPGRNDSVCVIFNEAAIKRMGMKEPLNQTISWSFSTLPHNLRIIGVVHDALTNAPFAPAEPTIYVYQPWLFNISYRLSPNVNGYDAVNQLRTIFNKYRPQFPYQYHFVDDSFASKFALENLVGKLVGIFAALAIFISCLGLFGLAAYVAEQRTREIGIRKVLGASVKGIFVLIVKDFVFLVAISSLIASPFAFYFLNNWLNGYYYHISISPAVFILSAAGAIVLALITISLKALRAAGMAPVKSLRSK
jgi:ABC-type antimicrobial peptide transport system permease subunit